MHVSVLIYSTSNFNTTSITISKLISSYKYFLLSLKLAFNCVIRSLDRISHIILQVSHTFLF